MKKVILSGAFLLGAGLFFGNMQAQSLNDLKKQRELLKLSTDLMDKRIDLMKEQENNAKKVEQAEKLNSKATKSADGFSNPDSYKDVANNAKDAAKALKKSESANRDVLKSNTKIIDLEKDIQKLELKINAIPYVLEIKEK